MTGPRAELFGVPLDGGTGEAVASLALAAPGPFWIVTANPEILLAAHEDRSYAEVLRRASWRTVDGIGARLALRLRGARVDRLTGVDLAETLLQKAAASDLRVACFGADELVATLVRRHWEARLPNLALRTYAAGRVAPDGSEDLPTRLAREAFEAWRPHVLLVALGGGQKQERWIDAHRAGWPWLRTVVGVGGAFDMWAGRRPRAPGLAQALGLEWLWRVALEPRRFGRIWRAVVVFPWTAFRAS